MGRQMPTRVRWQRRSLVQCNCDSILSEEILPCVQKLAWGSSLSGESNGKAMISSLYLSQFQEPEQK